MQTNLTEQQKATNFETMRHIERVRNLLNVCVRELLQRAEEHDQTKLQSPEVEIFTEFTQRLATSTYGSPEYEEFRKQMKPALDHHYGHNRHHPEFHKNGVKDMTLLDLIEMIVDWKAASERHNNGSILHSIEVNGHRFNMGPELIRIFENTAKAIF